MHPKFDPSIPLPAVLGACVAMMLTACGGGGSDAQDAQATITATSGPASAQLADAVLPEAAASQIAQPTFHVAPLLLNEPDDRDAIDDAASGRVGPRIQAVPTGSENLSTRRLTVQALAAAEHKRSASAADRTASGTAAPRAAASFVATYSPAQIRAAYGLPAMPAAGSALTATQAAQLGAGQTIYIVDAMHDPNAAAELAAFNQKFGLRPCTTKTIASAAALPLAAASAGDCEFAVVYASASGTMTATAPAYDAGWATEIALDVQWAHATAPLARIVLIEAADASLNSLLGAVKLANAMGPGVVSMSFGANEGNWTASVDAAFAGANMTYLAATGDSGAAVSWPAVSPNVVAVGGTSLTYTGSGLRAETGWSGTGGGTSAYTPTPSYQKLAVPGLGTVAHRTVGDVAFNADPSTGQYVAVIARGSTAVNWLSVGGTSLATPQWAGLIAVANALRAQAAKPALGAPHAVLYGQIASVPGLYAGAFADILQGADGACGTCSARVGYDPLTGLGTPNVANLLSALSGATPDVATAPVVSAAAITGKVGTPLAFNVSVTAGNPVAYSLNGAPSGMAISASGAVTWASPVAGSYSVTVVAKDTKTGLSGQGVATVQITKPGPVITAAAMTGVVGKAMSGTISIADPGASSWSVTISGAPAGMSFTGSGALVTATWARPVLGSYSLKVAVVDAAGLSATSNVAVTIAAK